MIDLSKLDPKTLRSLSETFEQRYLDKVKTKARVADSVVLMWLCRVGPDDWRYLHDTPEARAAHPTGRLVIRERLNGRRKYTPVKDMANAAHALQEARTQAVRRLGKAEDVRDVHTVAGAIDAYIRGRKSAGRVEAARDSRVVLGEWKELFPSVRRMAGINKTHLITFCERLRDKGQSERTVFNKYVRVRAWLRASGRGDLKLSPGEQPRFEKTVPTVYRDGEIERMLKCSDAYTLVLIELLRCTGLREREAQFLEWSDLDLQGRARSLHVRGKPAMGFKVKDAEARMVGIPASLVEVLNTWRKDRPGSLVLGIGPDNARSNFHLLRKVKAAAKRAGVADANLHKFRRTWAVSLLHAGLDLRTLQAMGGWSDLGSVTRYLRPAEAPTVQGLIDSVF